MADDKRSGSLSGLTHDEAKEFHSLFITSFVIFLVVAIVAHFLVWQWRPWFPSASGYTSMIDGVKTAASTAASIAFMA